MRVFVLALLVWAMACAARAEDTVLRGPPPAWVQTGAAPAEPARPISGDAVRAELLDQQLWFDDEGQHAFIRNRTAVYSPQAVTGLGTFAFPWNPASQRVTIHSIEILRGDERIDALAGRDFTILRREQNLEGAVVNGVLTAVLQLNDLRVGDRVEWALTLVSKVPILGDHAEFLATAAFPAVVDHYAFRASWPTAMGLRLKASEDWTLPPVRRQGDRSVLEMSFDNLLPVAVPEDAPLRFRRLRQIDGTTYASWSELGAVFTPLFAEAATLAPESALRAEVDRIRNTHPTRAAQVLAALRLVQDEVRYLALALGEGGLVPASADATWTRRLGDCKAKTALLIALLRELGVEARPVLVSSLIDNLDQRLPMVSLFDHVIVQAQVDGQTVWLDGARTGDRSLTPLTPIQYGWVLPLRAEGSMLVRIEPSLPALPLRETTLDFDLREGLYAPAEITGAILYRGDEAAVIQSQMSVASPAQREQYMRQVWQGLISDLTVTQVESAYDADRNELRLTLTGAGKIDWSSSGARRAVIPVSTISWDAGERRLDGPFRDLPVVANYPWFSRFRTTLTLPDGGEGFTLSAADIDLEAAAYRHRRRVFREGAQVVMERESIALRPEITEVERAAAVEPLERLARSRAEVIAPAGYDATSADLDALTPQAQETAAEAINRGLALNSNGQAAEAIAAFNSAIERDPSNANAWANRGIVRFWQGQAAEAAEDFTKALELNPSEFVAMNGRGLIALREERFLDAVVEFSMSLRLRPDDPFVLGVRSLAYAGLKQWDQSLADIERLRTLAPDAKSVDGRKASVLIMAGRYGEAVAVADAMADRTPNDPEVRQLQSTAREKLGDLAGAEAAVSAAIAAEPDHPLLLIRRAELRFRQGDLDGGRGDLATARPIASRSAGLLNNICWVQAVEGVDLRQALADCDAALALRPNESGMIDSRAFVLLQLGRLEEAKAAYDRALELAPGRAGSLYGRGLVNRALGRAAEAQSDIDTARRSDADVGKAFERYERQAASAAA